MRIESIIKSTFAVQEEMDSLAIKSESDYDKYKMAKAISEIAFCLRQYIIQMGGPNKSLPK